MAKIPSPLDALDRNNIPEEDRPPWLPKEVVAVLGDPARQRVGQVDVTADGRLIASNGRGVSVSGTWPRCTSAIG